MVFSPRHPGDPDAAGRFVPADGETGEPLELAMQELQLIGKILPAGGRLVVRHVFRTGGSLPVEAVYLFPLPRDAAVRRFRVVGDGFSVTSDLQPVRRATETYEQAIDDGHLAALTRVRRDGILDLALGNLRPGETVAVFLELVTGVELRDDGLRFRFPFTLAPGYHARAAASATPAGGEILLPGDEFGDVILPEWRERADGLHRVSFSLDVLAAGALREVSSPSHRVRVETGGEDRARVSLAAEGDVPDRDLVLDLRVADPRPTTLAGTDGRGRGHFAVVLPSRFFGEPAEAAPRRVVFVLDRSGSMDGPPLRQGKRALARCLAGLRPGDEFGIVAFDDEVETFPAGGELAPGDRDHLEAAREFLDRVDARGGTKILAGLEAGRRMLGGRAGDLFLVTDGQVYGSEEVTAGMRDAGCRVHALGIGSAARDRFLAGLARATGGESRFLGPRESVEEGVLALFAATGSPAAEGLTVTAEGDGGVTLEPAPPGAVFPGIPALVSGEADGPGRVLLRFSFRGPDGPETRELPVEIQAGGAGEDVALLRGARLAADLEATLRSPVPVDEGPEADAFRRLEELGRRFGLANRALALVAVVKREGDEPGRPPVTRVVPLGMPEDVRRSAYFHHARPRARMETTAAENVHFSMLPWNTARRRGPILYRHSASSWLEETELPAGASWLPPETGEVLDRLSAAPRPVDARLVDEALSAVAALVHRDTGMPGGDGAERVYASLVVLAAFLAASPRDPRRGPWRRQVSALLRFLRRELPAISPRWRGFGAVLGQLEEVAAGRESLDPDLEPGWILRALRDPEAGKELFERILDPA